MTDTRCWMSAAVVLLIASVTVASAKLIRRDTYLAAYQESHGPISTLPPGEVYAAPASSYGSPPASTYGTPSSDYGAPATATGYNYPEPHSAPENRLDPVHAKLVLLFKVLLKLLIFKLIVKFIAIICVFLFLPKLSGLGLAKEAAEDARKMNENGEENKLQVTQFVLDAISGSPGVCQPRDSPLCRLRRAFEEVHLQNSIPRIFKTYLREEEEKLRSKVISRKRHT